MKKSTAANHSPNPPMLPAPVLTGMHPLAAECRNKILSVWSAAAELNFAAAELNSVAPISAKIVRVLQENEGQVLHRTRTPSYLCTRKASEACRCVAVQEACN